MKESGECSDSSAAAVATATTATAPGGGSLVVYQCPIGRQGRGGVGSKIQSKIQSKSSRSLALEDLCEHRLRYGVFLRGHVSFCVREEEEEEEEEQQEVTAGGGGVSIIASRFIPANTRLLFMPVSSALTSASLAAEFKQHTQGQGQGQRLGAEGEQLELASLDWVIELKQAVGVFEQTYQCTCVCQGEQGSEEGCHQECCFKKVVTEDKVSTDQGRG